ncbi:flagellar hook-associated protein FliD [Aquitalea magnusonii]|uniref:Flagellar hook-associated protein 2 n=1 Tax=Aquitalea magnusonii TaxID=332411 RepID=A0A3G9GCV6_9NEIS|nr:flagellar filament capping protein FliD [Aquitalea magnusonii]BBF85275.1 flagellar hook-associated protein FliD [Aquitalea magnusonii]
MSSASITTSAGPLDVQNIVSQLMTVEKQPLTASQSKLKSFNSKLSDIGQVSSALSGLQTSVSGLASGNFLHTLKASSSDTTVATVDTNGSGIAGNYQLEVEELAKPRQLVFDTTSDGQAISSTSTALSNVPDALTLEVAGNSTTVQLREPASSTTTTPANVTLQDIADKINAAGAGVNASIVQYKGSYSLVLASAEAGSDNAFSISAGGTDSSLSANSANTLAGLQQSDTAISESNDASDASLTVNGVYVSSSSNTVSDVIGGVTLGLQKTGTASITLTQDNSSIASKLQGFVDAYNKVQSALDNAAGGSMKGDAALTSIRNQLSAVLQTPVSAADPVSSYAYLSQVGIAIQKDGTLSLDQTTFNKALSSKPAAVSNLFGNSSNTGFADRFSATINNLLGPAGIVVTKQHDLNQNVTDETTHQNQLQTKMSDKQANYLRQYTTLNATLAKMQQSTSNLSGLMAGVSSSGSSSASGSS